MDLWVYDKLCRKLMDGGMLGLVLVEVLDLSSDVGKEQSQK